MSILRISAPLKNARLGAFIVFIFCVSGPLVAQSSGTDSPRVATGHPCGLWDNEDIAAYKSALEKNTTLKAIVDKLQSWGDRRITEPINVPAHELKSDGTWSFPAFKRGSQDASGQWQWEWKFNTAMQQRSADVSNLGMLYAITSQEKYAACAKQILLALADAYGNGQGAALPNPPGYDHFAAYGFDGGDAGMFLAKVCHGYDLIYTEPSMTPAERTQIESALIRPMAEHLMATKYMYRSHGRWGLVCLYGIFISGVTLNDPNLLNGTLYGLGGTKENVTGGFMDCFKPDCMRDGVIWGADKKVEDQMASVAVLTTVAEVMWHRGVDFYSYQNKALKKPFDAGLADATETPLKTLLTLPGIDAYDYAFRHYRDDRFLALTQSLPPSLTFAIGEHLPSPPTTFQPRK